MVKPFLDIAIPFKKGREKSKKLYCDLVPFTFTCYIVLQPIVKNIECKTSHIGHNFDIH